MSQTRSGTRIERDAVATMLQVARLEVDEERLDELSGLLEAFQHGGNRFPAIQYPSVAPRMRP